MRLFFEDEDLIAAANLIEIVISDFEGRIICT
jgi:hypothetical protein